MFDAQKAAMNRKQLVSDEQKRQRAYEKRQKEIMGPVWDLEERKREGRNLGNELDGELRLNAERKREFQNALADAVPPALSKLIHAARKRQGRTVGNDPQALHAALELSNWLVEAQSAVSDPESDREVFDSLIRRGERLLNVVSREELANAR